MPWGHNLVLLTKLKDREARLAYASSALEHGWSRAVLVHHIEARTVDRQGKALTNFAERLRDAHLRHLRLAARWHEIYGTQRRATLPRHRAE